MCGACKRDTLEIEHTMRAVIQRVTQSSVSVDGKTVGEIGAGFVILLGVAEGDTERDARYLADKSVGLRVFPDDAGKMNLDILQIGGQILVISQFTLLGDCRKGRRPAFTGAAYPKSANQLYERFCELITAHGVHVERGVFAADMKVHLVNDGPVTLMLDSRKLF